MKDHVKITLRGTRNQEQADLTCRNFQTQETDIYVDQVNKTNCILVTLDLMDREAQAFNKTENGFVNTVLMSIIL
jgi:hypothetical protein